ncbi:hypothetical protein PGB90_004287 [Kerria lacca]
MKTEEFLLTISSTVVMFVLFFFGVRWFWSSAKKSETVSLIKILYGIFFGTPQVILESMELFLDTCEPTPATAWILFNRLVIIGEPEDLQIVLNNPNCLQKNFMYDFLKNALREGIFSAPVEKWRKHRRIINPAFNNRVLEGFFGIFNDKTNNLLIKLEEVANTDKYFDLWDYISPVALDVICQTTMGYNINSMESSKKEFEESLLRISVANSKRIYRPWLHPNFIFNIYARCIGLHKNCDDLLKLPKQVIKQKQIDHRERKLKSENNINNDKYSRSFLDILLDLNEEGAEFSDNDLLDEVLTMMIGGSETSAVTISGTLLMLAIHPEIQEKVYTEIKEILKDNKSDDIRVEDVNQMVYLEQCIKETLRMFPVGPFLARLAMKDIPLSNGFVIRTGDNIVIPPLKVHRHSKIYKNPLIWNPENFSEEEVAKRHKYSFIAFSGGPRGCIGGKHAMYSMKVSLSMILRKYILTTDVKLEDIKLVVDLLLRSASGYKVKMYSRNKN